MNINKETHRQLTVLLAGAIVFFHGITYTQVALDMLTIEELTQMYSAFPLTSGLPWYGYVALDWIIAFMAMAHITYYIYSKQTESAPGPDDLDRYVEQ